jgi:DNA-binding MarR family transcriptional regulator
MAQRSATPATNADEVQAFTRLVRASFAVTRELSAQLQADHGLTINAYEALLRLALSPGSRMRRVDLANSLMLTASGVTRLLDGLEREGLVGREACESDRRVTYAVLTKAGRDKLRQADRTHTRQIGELMSAYFDKAQLAQLSELLARLPGAEPSDPDGDKSSQA